MNKQSLEPVIQGIRADIEATKAQVTTLNTTIETIQDEMVIHTDGSIGGTGSENDPLYVVTGATASPLNAKVELVGQNNQTVFSLPLNFNYNATRAVYRQGLLIPERNYIISAGNKTITLTPATQLGDDVIILYNMIDPTMISYVSLRGGI